jgi:hypothetical protein
VAGVAERFEVGTEGADVNELGHGSHPGFSPRGPWRPTEDVSDPGTRVAVLSVKSVFSEIRGIG